MNDRRLLTDAVQRNCHISDARHGTDYTLCIYLMKMREYYRWERGIAFSARLPKEDVGNWLVERERLWESLGEASFDPLVIEGQSFDPFDEHAINQRLAGSGLVYGSGLGINGKPHFFLGSLERRDDADGFSVIVADEEYARDLAAPPAGLRERTVFVRRESLRRMLWEKLESWRWNRPDNALGRAFSCYDFENDLEVSLDAMTETELQAVLLHEIGEFQAGCQLGETWNRMLVELSDTPAELVARGVRDHLADCVYTLPKLIQEGRAASIHFYMGNLNNMRKAIFPGLYGAYEEWLDNEDWGFLEAMADAGREHWGAQATRMMEIFNRFGSRAAERMRGLEKEINL